MKRTNSAKKWTLVALIMFLLVAAIGSTYTRYISSANGTATAQVAKWAVKINNTDITDTDTFTVTLNEVENDDVVDGKIAPSSRLYADFIVDPTGSEVSVDYLFKLGNITALSGTLPEGISVEKVCYLNGTEEGAAITANANGEYVGNTITLPNQSSAMTSSQAVTIRVYLKWNDEGADNSVTDTKNVNHTSAGKSAPTLRMEIISTAKQHITTTP